MNAQTGLLLLLLTLSLISCYEGRGELNFNTEPTIFRGVWTAQAKNDSTTQIAALRLELTATYLDRSGYTVTGTLKFADDAPLTVAGSVNGSQSERYLQAPLPPTLNLELRDASDRIGFLKCIWPINFAEKRCDLTVEGGLRKGLYTVVNMVKP